MKRPRLIVFAGKPGVGKTAVIERIKAGFLVVDVWPFLVPYIDPSLGVPPEEKNILGYRDMYRHVADLDSGDIIIEIGTNYPDLNIGEIAKLSEQYDVRVVLCDAPVEVIRTRGRTRGYRYNPSFELRLKRDFPNSHLKELEKTSLRYDVVDMQGELIGTTEKIKKLLSL